MPVFVGLYVPVFSNFHRKLTKTDPRIDSWTPISRSEIVDSSDFFWFFFSFNRFFFKFFMNSWKFCFLSNYATSDTVFFRILKKISPKTLNNRHFWRQKWRNFRRFRRDFRYLERRKRPILAFFDDFFPFLINYFKNFQEFLKIFGKKPFHRLYTEISENFSIKVVKSCVFFRKKCEIFRLFIGFFSNFSPDFEEIRT